MMGGGLKGEFLQTLILLNILCKIFLAFNTCSCFNKLFFKLLDDTWLNKNYYYYYYNTHYCYYYY